MLGKIFLKKKGVGPFQIIQLIGKAVLNLLTTLPKKEAIGDYSKTSLNSKATATTSESEDILHLGGQPLGSRLDIIILNCPKSQKGTHGLKRSLSRSTQGDSQQ